MSFRLRHLRLQVCSPPRPRRLHLKACRGTGPGVLFARQGPQEGTGRGEHFRFADLGALLCRARQFQQRAPHQPFAPLDAA
ncbi:hypothetical protein ACLESD_31080, partial [Pyxidicoccus sp. 3LFB2]